MCITRVPSWHVYVLGSPSASILVVLSKAFVVRYYRVGCLYYWRGGRGSYPRLVLRESQLITDRRPIPKRRTCETALPIAVSTTLTKITAEYTFSLQFIQPRVQDKSKSTHAVVSHQTGNNNVVWSLDTKSIHSFPRSQFCWLSHGWRDMVEKIPWQPSSWPPGRCRNRASSFLQNSTTKVYLC